MKSGRREFLGLGGAALVGRGLLGQVSRAPLRENSGEVAVILGHPAVSLNAKDYGAVGDGVTKDTVALQAAIDRCGVFGGGEVVVPAGTFLTGGLELRSRVTLRFEAGAVLKGSADLADYKVGQVRWEGKWIQGYLGLISARDCVDVAIVGRS